MKQRIQEQTKPKKLGGSVYITLSPVVRQIAGIEVGQAVFIETKVHPRKPTAEQLNFIEVMRKQGAIAGVVYSIDELKTLLNKC